jgi:menaquinone-dependent protoporphyrinogen oxidase
VKVLISVASKHGATEEIGERIAERLCARRIDAHVIPPTSHPKVETYDACIIGSALYMGRWMKEAKEFVAANVEELRERPVWLFASGPVMFSSDGPVANIVDDPADLAEGDRVMASIGARENKLFAGRLQKDGLNFGERAVVRMIHSPWGDYRPWQEIDQWADSIARELILVEA